MRNPTARLAAAPALLLALLSAACTDSPSPAGPEDAARKPAAAAATDVTEDFDLLDPALWLRGDHVLGRGRLRPENVAAPGGVLTLTLPAGTRDGAEVQSVARHGFGSYAARMRTQHAPGSISAFFLYQGVARRNDELDVELFNDGSRRVMFTVWVAGKQTWSATHVLPFDPAADFHEYRIDYAAGRVRFGVDGVPMQEWTARVPRNAMFVMANTWWPVWLDGEVPPADAPLLVDRIRY